MPKISEMFITFASIAANQWPRNCCAQLTLPTKTVDGTKPFSPLNKKNEKFKEDKRKEKIKKSNCPSKISRKDAIVRVSNLDMHGGFVFLFGRKFKVLIWNRYSWLRKLDQISRKDAIVRVSNLDMHGGFVFLFGRKFKVLIWNRYSWLRKLDQNLGG